jgi:hypothetical protein
MLGALEILFMSKFTVKLELEGYEVKLQGLKVSVEGTKEDAPKIAQQIERQLSGMIQAPAVIIPASLAPVNENPHPPLIDAEITNVCRGDRLRSRLHEVWNSATKLDNGAESHVVSQNS